MKNYDTTNRPEAWSYRVYLDPCINKASLIVRNRETVEAIVPKDHGVIVKLFCWRRLSETYLVSWMGDHFKWDPCRSESDH